MLFQNIYRLSIASGNIRERSIIFNRAQHIVTISAIYSRRFYGSETFDCKKADTSESKKAKPKVPPLPDPCADKICNRKIRKKSFWRRLLEPVEDPPLPPKECCRAKPQVTCDPDLSEFGGKAYRTCGSAYIIQKDILPVEDCEEDKESKILKKMEVDLDFKNVVTDDPLPKFKSAELRLLELSDNKLHAAYKKYNSVMKKHIEQKKMKLYKTVAWPIDMHEIPARFNINKTLLEKKNLEYVEFKRIEPPRQLIERIVEMQRNARPTLERKTTTTTEVVVDESAAKDVVNIEPQKGAVFDTLQQVETKF